MNLLHALSVLLLASALPGQSPLVTTYGSNGGGPEGGQVLFDLTVQTAVTITRLDVHTDSPIGTAGRIEVYTTPTTWVGNEGNPGLWTPAGSGPATSAGFGTPTAACMTPGIVLAPGSYGVAVRYVGLRFLRTNGNGVNQQYSTAELTLTAGASQNVPWATTFQPRVFNGALHYLAGSVAGSFVCTARANFGQGCGGLTMSSLAPPLVGTTLILQTAGIPAGAALTVQVLSFTQFVPGLDLGPLGAPGCVQSVGLGSPFASTVTGTWNRPLVVPGGAVLLGLCVYGQSASVVSGVNALGLITSDGVQLTLGNVIG